MKKLTTYLGLSLFILIVSSFSNVDDSTIFVKEIEKSIDISALNEELPDIYAMVDFNSFNIYNQKLENGEITQVKAYNVKQNGVLIGIAGEIHGSAFYAEDKENSFTFYDLTNGIAFTTPKTFDVNAKNKIPDFEQITLFKHDSEKLDADSTKGWCYAFCLGKHVACVSACGVVVYGGATIATGSTGGVGVVTFVVAGAAQAACVALCLVNYNSCLAWCDS